MNTKTDQHSYSHINHYECPSQWTLELTTTVTMITDHHGVTLLFLELSGQRAANGGSLVLSQRQIQVYVKV